MIIIIYNLILSITKMRPSGTKAQIWFRNGRFKSQTSNLTVDADFDELSFLKKQAKRIGILTRMENKSKARESIMKKVRPMSSVQRENNKRTDLNFKKIEMQYLKEKSLAKEALEKQSVSRERQEGLLGQMKRYEEMSKQELIQKLISLQHLANTIFKRNKFLEEELQKVKSNQKL